MKIPPISTNESERLKALNAYRVLDTFPEEEYDQITRLAAYICRTPVSLVSLIDPKRQFFKSHHGVDISETPREVAFCAHAILTPDQIMEVPDSRKDPRFQGNPLITDKPHIIFYAGIPLISPEGHALGTLCVIDREPRQLTLEQKEALKTLADQVVRLLDLRKKNRLLEEKQFQLERSNQSLDQFAYSASHDLKEPLRMVGAFLKLIEKQYGPLLDEKGQKYIGFAVDGANRMETMVRDLLEYSRVGRGNHPREFVDMADVIKHCQHLYQGLIEEKGAEIHHDPMPKVCMPRVPLQQVMGNLIVNALKYQIGPDHPKIHIGVQEDGEDYVFSVRDNGIGIPVSHQERVFEPFKRLHSRTVFAGTGIGLAICKKIIENHQGKIWVESDGDNGSVFYFTLPKKGLENG